MKQDTGQENSIPSKKVKPNGLFVTALALLIGFLIIGASFATSRRLSYLFYYLNWYQWPRWYSLNLWILAFGAAVNYFVRSKRLRYILFTGVLAAFFVVMALYSVWLRTLIYWIYCLLIMLHYSVFRPYFYAPLTEFFSSGTVTWRLFIAPGAGLALIMILLFSRHAFSRTGGTKPEDHGEEKKED